jgi:ubiquinone/menaquinone biosynthesis C-methylase UbiE
MAGDYRKEVRRLYDAISDDFDKTRVKPDQFLETLVNRGFSRENEIILDNGCGNCRNLRVFARGIMVAGDLSRNMLKQCIKNTLGKEVYCVQYELTHLPFRSSVFNTIVCISAIHHLKEKEVESALTEMGRVLRDRGWMLVSSWSRKMVRDKRFQRKAMKIDESYFLVSWGPRRRFYFLMDAKTLRSMCLKTGFEDAIILEYGMNNYSLVDRRKY